MKKRRQVVDMLWNRLHDKLLRFFKRKLEYAIFNSVEADLKERIRRSSVWIQVRNDVLLTRKSG